VIGTVKGKGKGKGKGKSKGKARYDEATPQSKAPRIAWRVEWRFDHCGQVFVDNGFPEEDVLAEALERFLENKWAVRATRHLLLPYVAAGVDQLEVFLHQPPLARAALRGEKIDFGIEASDEEEEYEGQQRSVPVEQEAARRQTGCEEDEPAWETTYQRLDKGRSLRENLTGRAVLEFPVLQIALPSEVSRYCGSDTKRAQAELEATIQRVKARAAKSQLDGQDACGGMADAMAVSDDELSG
jgi:hypothetical protein